MSKKCCGIVYSKEDKVCKVCGKELIETEAEEINIDELVDMYSSKDENKPEEESVLPLAEEMPIEEKEDEPKEDEPKEDEPKEEPIIEKKAETAEIDRLAALSEFFADEDEMDAKDKKKKKKKKRGSKDDRLLRATGILAMVLAFLGLLGMLASAYFMIIKPSYIKEGAAEKELNYPYISTSGDASVLHPLLIDLASETDAASDTDALGEGDAQ